MECFWFVAVFLVKSLADMAEVFAAENGGIALEMTPGGKWLSVLVFMARIRHSLDLMPIKSLHMLHAHLRRKRAGKFGS